MAKIDEIRNKMSACEKEKCEIDHEKDKLSIHRLGAGQNKVIVVMGGIRIRQQNNRESPTVNYSDEDAMALRDVLNELYGKEE